MVVGQLKAAHWYCFVYTVVAIPTADSLFLPVPRLPSSITYVLDVKILKL